MSTRVPVFEKAAEFPVARGGFGRYAPPMNETLEQRVQELEKKVAELTSLLSEPRRKKDWTQTVGIFDEDDAHFESAVRLGREWRQQQTYEKEIAGS